MKIAFFTDTYEPQVNGVVTSINLFMNELRKNGNEVHIFCPHSKGLKANKYIHPLKSIEFKPYPDCKIGIPGPRIFSITKKINPDIIHIHVPAPIGLAGLSIAKALRIPILMTYHTFITDYMDYLPLLKNKLTQKLNKKTIDKYTKWFYNRADAIIAPSTETKMFLKKIGIKREIIVLPTGIKLSKIDLKRKINKKPIILHVGRICKEKNIDVIIKAFNELQKMDASLLITSFGPYEQELKNLVKKLNLEKKVRFTGFVSESKKEQLYKKADLFVASSTTDTQGIVLLEAMKYGTPVIAADAKGFKDFVKNNSNGFLFRPGSVKDLAKKMKHVLKNEKLWKRLSNEGYKKAKKFSIGRCTERLENIYNIFSGKQKVSVIVPTYMEEKYIGKTLKSVKNQNYKNFEIIVVDSSSSDKTVKIAKKYADKIIVTKKRGVARARNIGAKKAKGEILIFLDADTSLKEDFLDNILRKFIKNDVIGVVPKITCKNKKSKILFDLENKGVKLSILIDYPMVPATCVCYKKKVFQKVGGFNEDYITSEDIDLSIRTRHFGRFIYASKNKVETSDRRVKTGRRKMFRFWLFNVLKTLYSKTPSKDYPCIR